MINAQDIKKNFGNIFNTKFIDFKTYSIQFINSLELKFRRDPESY